MSNVPFMPSLRGTSRPPGSRPRETSTAVIVLSTLLATGLVTGLIALSWPDDSEADTPIDAAPPPLADAAPTPTIATRAPRARPPVEPSTTPSLAPSSPDAGPTSPPPFRSRRRAATFSLRDEARRDAARNPPPAPGAVLCQMASNTLIPLLGRTLFTTAVGEFRTLANQRHPCGGPLDLAIELTDKGLVVNGLRFNGRSACLADFRTTVLELEDTPDRFYAAWILPEGGTIRACPDSQTLSTLSRKQRTPRQRSPRSPSASESPTPAQSRPPWMPRNRSNSDDSNETPAWR